MDDDLLAAWMAHHIAERIEAAEQALEGEGAEAQNACATAILELWQHRNVLPEHLRPLRDLEPILRTLAYLGANNAEPRYYPEALREAAVAKAAPEAKKWLDLAIGVDYTARLLVAFGLRLAATHAGHNAEPWVELASQAGAENEPERQLVRIVIRGQLDTNDTEAEAECALRDRLERLDTFISLAASLADELRTQLGDEAPAG